MLFSSLEFLIFFPVVLALCGVLPRAGRRVWLLVASYYFYMSWNPPFVLLLVISTVVDFCAARRLMVERRPLARRLLLLLSLCTNLGLLGYFKYAGFFAGNLSLLGLSVDPGLLNVILPLGISFYTFQTMSYTIDVYRGQLQATDRFLDFALYVSFFPQLIAGPIVRASQFLPQLLPLRDPTREDRRAGAELLLIGFFKKVYLADNLAIVVDSQLAHPEQLGFAGAWLAIYAFAFQIYFDFSGYTDIARGLGRILGFRLPQNFNLPYLAANITDFWRRWHMTLSSWLRDYLYIPLGGNRGSRLRTYRNLMLTMLLGGLWHGAGWNFVIWGGLHGVYLAIHKLWMESRGIEPKTAPPATGARRVLGIAATFHLVCLTWVFFRMPTLDGAWTVVRAMFLGAEGAGPLAPVFAGTPFYQALAMYGLVRLYLARSRAGRSWAAWLFFAALAVFLVAFVPPGTRKFIYFEF